MNSGIYEIQNVISGKSYIGSAVDLDKRKKEHLSTLRMNKHYNKHLQSAFNKYGEDAFKFVVLEMILFPEGLISLEQKYLDELKLKYNVAPMAGSQLGMKHTEETRKK